MPTPEIDDDVSTLRTGCPFCSGVYSVAQGTLRHSEPPCSKWNALGPTQFLAEARAAGAKRDASKGARR